MKNIDIFVLAGNWPSWVQTTNYNQLSAECGFKVSSVFKVFIVQRILFVCVPLTMASMGSGQWSKY